jgi:hypothetical protein
VKIRLVDGTFPHCNAVGLAGENQGEGPSSFAWDRSGGGGVKVFTDLALAQAVGDPAPMKIAMLVESPAYSEGALRMVRQHAEEFDAVLTFNADLLRELRHARFYPLGGSWIAEWGLFEKSKMVSIIVGAKRDTEGHEMRHRAADLDVDRYGKPYTDWMESKAEALRDYRYSIVIENVRHDYYFTEKLIDCISQGTIPIYWGCPSIGDFFDPNGVLTFETVEQLERIMDGLSKEDYLSRFDAVRRNIELARQYRCAEDWIADRYPYLFHTGGTK